MSPSEKTVLKTFRQFLVAPGEMLCFYGPNLENNKVAFELLMKKSLLVKEHYKGAYSLTQAGFEEMNACEL